MKIAEKIANNKIAVLIIGAHWIVLTSAVIGRGDIPDSDGHFSSWGIFTIAVLIFDLPAIAAALLICLPLRLFPEDGNVYQYGFLFTSLFTITFQWLFVIKLLYNPFSKDAEKYITLSLKDE